MFSILPLKSLTFGLVAPNALDAGAVQGRRRQRRVAFQPIPGEAGGQRRVPGELADRAVQPQPLVVVVRGEMRRVDAVGPERIVPGDRLEPAVKVAVQVIDGEVVLRRAVAELGRRVRRLVVDRDDEVDKAVAGAGPVRRGADLRPVALDVVAVHPEVPGRVALPLEVAAGVLAVEPDVERIPGRRVRLRERRAQVAAARAAERRAAVEQAVLRQPVGVHPVLEGVVLAAKQVDVHVVAAEVLAVEVDPVAGRPAAAQQDRRQRAVGQVAVLLGLGAVLRVDVGDDRTDRDRALHRPLLAEVLRTRRRGGEKAGDHDREEIPLHGVPLALSGSGTCRGCPARCCRGSRCGSCCRTAR